jgi:hypothetical protein
MNHRASEGGLGPAATPKRCDQSRARPESQGAALGIPHLERGNLDGEPMGLGDSRHSLVWLHSEDLAFARG